MLCKAILTVAVLAISPVSALWPLPQKLSTGTNVLVIDQTVKVTYNGASLSNVLGYSPPPGSKFNSQELVQAGVARALKSILQDNYVPWMLHQRSSSFEPSVHSANKLVRSIKIVQTGKDDSKTFKPRAGDVDESYTLNLSKDGDASISAKSYVGVLHALQTFSQLFFKHSSGNAIYTTQAPVSIVDSPNYAHRGVMLDVARSFLSVNDIKRTIDAMAWNKLNRIHLHCTDSQSWPLEIPSLPKLSELGAYHPSLTYSPSDVASIYEYAIQRGIEVIMEIDMPAHSGVIDLAYKDLIIAYQALPYQNLCAEPPCGMLSLNSSKVYDFLDKLFDDILPRVAQYSAYFHTGGDELNVNDMLLDPTVRSNKTEVVAPLLQKFLNHAHGKIRAAGLSPLVWEEMVTGWNMTLSNDAVVQSWLGGNAVKDLASAGLKVIDSDFNFYYLDCGRGQWVNFPNGQSYNDGFPFNDWCGPTKSWRLIYSHDPRANLTKEAAGNVLGGEVAVWTETIDSTNLDSILWPRASAAGEVWWSGNKDTAGVQRDQLEVTPRLSELRALMIARGVQAMPVQMPYCTQHNASACTLFE